MKAYRNEDGTVRLFRPDKNMARMNRVSVHLDALCVVPVPTFLLLGDEEATDS